MQAVHASASLTRKAERLERQSGLKNRAAWKTDWLERQSGLKGRAALGSGLFTGAAHTGQFCRMLFSTQTWLPCSSLS